MRSFLLIFLCMSIAMSIVKKQISIHNKFNTPIVASDVKMSDVDLALYQNDVQQGGQRNHLNVEITNWASAKETVLSQLTICYSYFELFVTKQQQVGILLVCIICFAFYLMVKSEDRNLKLRKQNTKKRQHQEQEAIVQILTESIIGKEQSPLPQVSTILGSINYEERVNKSADNAIKHYQHTPLQRCNSQPFIKMHIPDYSAEEINSLLKDIN